MKEFVSTISSKGQVTIPADVRKQMGVGASDKIVFVFGDGDKVEIHPVRSRVADLYGSVPALPRPDADDLETIIAEAYANRAAEVVRELEDK